MALRLRQLPATYAITRLAADAAIPDWADGPGFASITRTTDELSIICRDERMPGGLNSDGPWTCFQLLGPFDLSESGIAIRLLRPVSEAGIGFLFVTTFDTDYLLVRTPAAPAAISALVSNGIAIAT
jgi:uncharacterized protein